MRKLVPVLVVILIIAAVQQSQKHKTELARAEAEAEAESEAFAQQQDELPEADEREARRPTARAASTAAARYSCDGRTRCPEMHSCNEALWFLEHCPGTKMDGDRDGVPCEDQWCSHLR